MLRLSELDSSSIVSLLSVAADLDDVILGQKCIEIVTDLFVAQLRQHIIYSLCPFDCL